MGSMSDQKKRQPAGIPVGGEFAANEHDEAPSGLSSNAEVEGLAKYEIVLANTQNPGLIDFREHYDGLRAENAAAWIEDHFERDGYGWDAIGGLPAGHREEALSVLRAIAQETDEDEDSISASMQRERRTQVRVIGMQRNRDDSELVSLRIAGTEVSMNHHELEAWGNAMLARAREVREGTDLTTHPTAAIASAAAARFSSWTGERPEDPDHERRELQKMRAELTAYVDAYPEPADPSLYTAEQRAQWREDRTLAERDAVQRIDRALGMLDWQQGKK